MGWLVGGHFEGTPLCGLEGGPLRYLYIPTPSPGAPPLLLYPPAQLLLCQSVRLSQMNHWTQRTTSCPPRYNYSQFQSVTDILGSEPMWASGHSHFTHMPVAVGLGIVVRTAGMWDIGHPYWPYNTGGLCSLSELDVC